MKTKLTILLKLFFLLLSIDNLAQKNAEDTIVVYNLGSNVNTTFPDLNPKITADGQELFFTRRIVDNGQVFEEIWVSEKNSQNKWDKAIKLLDPFNRGDKNSVSFVSTDGNKVIIKGVYRDGKLNLKERGFSILKKSKTGWSQPEVINVEAYNLLDKGLHNGMAMSSTQDVMIFTISEVKDVKDNDLYISFIKPDGNFTKPIKLAANINTSSNEFSPFLASDNTTMYFASNRPGGLGETDIWITKRLDSTWQNWSNPVNLGAPVNTKDKEGYYSVDASSQYAYMVSDKNSLGEADVIRIKLRKDQQANPVVLVSGKVLDRRVNKPIESRIIYKLMPEGTKAGEVHTDPISGEYKIILPYGRKYEFFAGAKGYLSETSFLDLTQVAEYQERKIDLGLIPIEVGQIVKMNNIFFEYKSSILAQESFIELDRIVDEMEENPTMEIEIEGHTDDKGSHEYNVLLSGKRADIVRQYLITKVDNPNRVKSVGYGETKPIAPNDTEEGRSINRRVEFTVTHK